MIMSRPLQRRFHHSLGLQCLLCILLRVATPAEASPQKVSFPGLKSETKSPDGHYTIRNLDDENQEPAHTLSLIDAKTGLAIKIYSYGRGVDVLWSPSSDALVVNDNEGSDTSHPVLFVAPWKDQPVDLREKLIEFLRGRVETKSALRNHHVYFSARRWLSHDEILCRMDGYGEVDPDGFTVYYVYTLGKGFRVNRKNAGGAGAGNN